MKFDFKNILIGVVIGVLGTTSVFLIVGDVDIQTDVQFGESLDKDDKDIKIKIEKIIDDNDKVIINIEATGSGSVTKEDIDAELEKLYADKDIDISSENVNIEIKITN